MHTRFIALTVSGLLLAASACSDDTHGAGGAGGTGGAGGGPAPQACGAALDFMVGGDRPVNVCVPLDHDPETPAPLIILLHGYAATGFLQDVGFQELSIAALARGAIFAAPDGTRDDDDRQFWNATDACCNFFGSDVDDSAYLIGLVDEIASNVSIDPARVFFIGHSNGGFMSHRMACDHADRIAAIISLAGMMHLDPADCGATEPVSVLQIHGTDDMTIFYDGGTAGPDPDLFPSVAETLATWIDIDGCGSQPSPGDALDLDALIEGAETQVSSYGDCEAGTTVEHWAMQDGSHIPAFHDYAAAVVADWLLAHPKGG